MKVLVTGASGFLGSHIAEQLAAEGHEVRTLLRKTSSREWLQFPHEEVIGDVTDEESLGAAVEGVDAVVHSAALIKARSEAEFDAANRGGTANLLAAIEATNPGLRRLVYISSVAAHGASKDGKARAVDAPAVPLTLYGRTKLGGERAVRQSPLADRSVVFRMPVIYGPRDPALLPFFQAARLRVAPLLDGGHNRTSVVYATDAASAVVLAVTAEADVGGKTYAPEDGEVYTWRDMLAAIKAAVGHGVLMVPTPKLAYQAGATVSELFGRATGRAVVFTREKVREMAQPAWVVSSEDLRRDLGWEARVQMAEGARLTYEWYRAAGWL